MTLWWTMLTGASLIWVFTMSLLAFAFARRRHSPLEARQESRLWLWGLGIVFPLITLGALLVHGLIIGERMLARTETDVVAVSAHAERWRWTFGYALTADRPATVGVLHIPAGQPIDVHVSTGDVIHSFWVPRLAGKLDAIPGRTQVLRIAADRPGTFSGRSSEFSGEGYLQHTFEVIAHDAAGWDAFLRGELAQPSDGEQ